ncbi:hypothetical protein LI328DRAFT_166021 [Trichoderma asperelloides]|nr:hypothetical protein LI328DRAFT_166021 [Trichoderma asperelloides]
MKRSSFELDPRGDVLLILRHPNQQELVWDSSTSTSPDDRQEAGNIADKSIQPKLKAESDELSASLDEPNETDEPEEVQFRLSSRHLSLASPVFSAMLHGGWKESAGLVKQPEQVTKKEMRETHSEELQLRYEISATEWNAEAFLLLMNIIHGHHRKVPHYYKCHESIEVFAHLWVDKLSSDLPTSYGRESMIWLFVSWVYSNTSVFEKMTGLAMKEGKGSLETMCLPLPPILISDIEQERLSSLCHLLRELDDLREGLIKGSKGCSFECSSMLLGSLIKEMDKHKLSQYQLLDAFSDQSLQQLKLVLTEFQTPLWCTRSNDRYPRFHTCSIRSMLEPVIDSIWGNLNGLKLDYYRVR